MQRQPKILLAMLALAAAPALATPQSEPAAQPASVAPWETVAASGPVQARPAEETLWSDVARGDSLRPNTLVQTGRKGRATLTRRSSLVILDPQSRVELPGEGRSGFETSVVQTEGRVLYKVDGRSEPHFEVVTPFLVAGVKGTSFLVTVNERYASVTVEHGLVEITNPATGEVLELGPGQTIVREQKDVELELAQDDRRSREESKRMQRMVEGLERDRLEASAAVDSVADVGLTLGDVTGDLVTVEETGALDVERTVEVPVLDTADELLQELIREGFKNGTIVEPAGDTMVKPN